MVWEKPQIYIKLSWLAVSRKHITSKWLNASTNEYQMRHS